MEEFTETRCQCGGKLIIDFPYIRCVACGTRKELIDYPISWDFWRGYAVYYDAPDPGSNQPPVKEMPKLVEKPKLIAKKPLPKLPAKPKPKKIRRIVEL